MTFQQAFCGVLLPFHTSDSIIISTVFIPLLRALQIALVIALNSVIGKLKAVGL